MTKILCIDASTEACSVAIKNGSEVIDKYQLAPRKHAALILPQVKELLQEAGINLNELDAIACNIGPGAFTGIRIAVSIAQGLSFGASIPSIAISSLESLAHVGKSRKPEIDVWICAIDARMNEVYFAVFELNNGDILRRFDECVIAPEKIDWDSIIEKLEGKKLGLIGSGWSAYPDQMLKNEIINSSIQVENEYPSARHSLDIASKKLSDGEAIEAKDLQPMYLRNNVAEKKKV